MFIDTAHVDPPLIESATDAAPVGRDLSPHRDLRRDEFWRALPGYAAVSEGEFRTHQFQQKHAVINVRQLRDTVWDPLESTCRHASLSIL